LHPSPVHLSIRINELYSIYNMIRFVCQVLIEKLVPHPHEECALGLLTVK